MSNPPREFELTAKRVSKIKDNADCAPLDLLRMVIDDIESGETTCDGLFVVCITRKPDTGWDITRYRANLRRHEEIALLSTAHFKAVRAWVDDTKE